MTLLTKRTIWVLLLLFGIIGIIWVSGALRPNETGPLNVNENIPVEGLEADEQVVITFAADLAFESIYEPLVEKFEAQNPNIKINFIPYDAADEQSADLRALASLADITIIQGRERLIQGAAYFRDLTPLMESDPNFLTDDFWPGALAACQDASGFNLGIPLSLYFTGILFDEAAFDAIGLPYPAPGWTWDDFYRATLSLARPLDSTGKHGFVDNVVSLKPYSPQIFLLAPLLDTLILETGGEVDGQELFTLLARYYDQVLAGIISPVQKIELADQEREQRSAMFANGHPPMWVGGINSWLKDGPALDVASIAPFPIGEDGKNDKTSPLSPVCGVVSAGTLHAKEAWRWLNFLSYQWIRGDDRMAVVNEAIPARPSVVDANRYWNTLPEKAQEAMRFAVDHGWFGSVYPEVIQVVSEELIDAISSETGLLSAVTNAETRISALPKTEQTKEGFAVATPVIESEDVTTVDYFTYAVFDSAQAYNDLAEQFHKLHPDIHIRLPSTRDPYAFPSAEDDLFIFPAEKYDCFAGRLPNLGHKEPAVVLSLDELLSNEDPSLVSDFYPGQMEAYMVGGKLYGLPASSEPTLMFYNKDLLNELGIDPPDYDWTFDDFLDLATAASTAYGEERTLGFLSFSPEDLYLFLAGHGTVWSDISKELPIVNFDQPDVANAYKWLSSLATAGVLYPVTMNDSSIVAAELVSSGRVAFWTDVRGSWDGWYYSGELKFDVGAVPLPETGNANQVTNVVMVGQFISRSAQNPQACWEWLKFLSEQPGAFSGIPAKRSLLESDAWRAILGVEKTEVYQAVMYQSKLNWIRYNDPFWSPILYWGNVAFAEVLNGWDIEQSLQVAQRKADRFLACLETSNLSTYSGNQLAERINACSAEAEEA